MLFTLHKLTHLIVGNVDLRLRSSFKLILVIALIFLYNPTLAEARVKPAYEKSIGGYKKEIIFEVIDGGDGSSILIGETNSMGSGDTDAYLLKVDYFGNIEWNKTYGGLYSDRAYTAIKSEDGGYVIAGSTTSDGLYGDIFIIRTTASGKQEWSTHIGGNGNDWAQSLVQIKDGYVLVGSTQFTSEHDYDIYVVKIDNNGNRIKTTKLGGPGQDYGKKILKSEDGGFLILGNLENPKTLFSDVFLVKLNEDLEYQWNRTYGSEFQEKPSSIIGTSDGGYLITGTSKSSDDQYDVFVIKLDSEYGLEWSKTYGSPLDEHGNSCIESSDNNFLILGRTSKTDNTGIDFFLLKIDPSGNEIFSNHFGTSQTDFGMSLYENNYNDLILAGYSSHKENAYILRFNQNWLYIDSEYGEPQGESLNLFGQIASFAIDPITIDVSDNERIIFTGWESDDSIGYNGEENEHSINMTQEITEVAKWEKQFRIIASIEMGNGKIVGTGWYKEGTKVNIKATPDEEYTFIGWDGTGIDDKNRKNHELIFSLDRPIILNAWFQMNGTYYLEVISEYGEVTGSDYYPKGTKAFFSVEPEVIQLSSQEQLVFNGWKSEKVDGYNGPDNHAVVEVTSDLTEIANWKKQFYVTINGPTSTDLDGWYDQGDIIDIPLIVKGGIIRRILEFYLENGQIISDTIQVNAPLTLYTEWKTDYSLVYFAVGFILIMVVAILFYIKKKE
jgi:hypothetical protein